MLRVPAASLFLPALLTASLAQAQTVRVFVERHGNEAATADFSFATVPAPSAEDAATDARFIAVDGDGDGNSTDLSVLHDGRVPEQRDQPGANFFFAAGTDGGRFAIDLKHAIDIARVNTYSWHPDTRGPQVYVVFGSDGSDPAFSRRPKRGTDPTSVGWTRIASVDTRPEKGAGGGQYGVSILREGGSLGRFRYLLFDVSRTESRDAFGNTFFSEIDVVDAASGQAAPLTPGIQKVTIDGGRWTAVIDTTGAIDLAPYGAEAIAPMLREWYPRLVELLGSDGFVAPSSFRIAISDAVDGIAATGGETGTEISCGGAWMREHRSGEATGAVFHELAHVVQHYGTHPAPAWLTEGIADYLRWYLFEPDARGADIDTREALAQAHHDGSYRISANFLDHVVRRHDAAAISALNAACRGGTYTDALFAQRTGHTLSELEASWKQEIGDRIAADETANTLSDAEVAAGWRLLFDGSSFTGWHNFKQRRVREGWQVERGALTCADPHRAGDLVTADRFAWFELQLDYRIEPGGNSGIMFRVADEGPAVWATGPEFQLEDNAKASDPTRCGWLYGLYQPPNDPATDRPIDATKPAGEWNHVRLLVSPEKCEHEINGVKYFDYVLGSEDFAARVARSKFASMPGFASAATGRIALQGDHGRISFRNIKLREIEAH